MKEVSNWLNTKSFKEQDEYYTPSILVKPIISYLKPNSVIWCPFDTEDSEFVIELKKVVFPVLGLPTKARILFIYYLNAI